MKSIHTLIKFAGVSIVGATLLFSAACSKTHDASVSTTTTPAATTDTTVAANVNANDTWTSIKGYTYQQKSDFAAKANEVAAKLDRDAAAAKGAAANRLAEARDELRTAANEVSNATADTWDATKDRVGRAMQKADSAYHNAAE